MQLISYPLVVRRAQLPRLHVMAEDPADFATSRAIKGHLSIAIIAGDMVMRDKSSTHIACYRIVLCTAAEALHHEVSHDTFMQTHACGTAGL